MTNGTTANQTGQRAERVIACMLHERGYSFERQVYLGKSIYGHKRTRDFLVSNIPEFPNGLIIESKWQGSGVLSTRSSLFDRERPASVPLSYGDCHCGRGHRPGQ